MTYEPCFSLSKKILLICILFINASFCFAQYGLLDRTFGTGGVVTAGMQSTLNLAPTATTQADGKILVVGRFSIDTPTLSNTIEEVQYINVSRYNVDGSLDTTFGNKGAVLTYLVASSAISIAVQKDGKIVLGGSGYDYYLNDNTVLLRYHGNGQPDSSFGTNGIAVYQSIQSFGVGKIQVLSDGSIIAQGAEYGQLMLMRCDSAGRLDGAFGKFGVVVENASAASSFGLQCDGKIIAMGYTRSLENYLSRFNPDGSPDMSFGKGDSAPVRITNARCIAIKNDGKIIVAGNGNTDNSNVCRVEQFLPDGTPDSSFGYAGIALINFPTNLAYYEVVPTTVIVQPDQKILIGATGQGYPYYSYIDTYYFAVARITTEGAADTTFGTRGLVQNNFGASTTLLMQPDGKIIQVGNTRNESNTVIVRYTSGLSSGPIDSCMYPSYSFTQIPDDIMQVYPNPCTGLAFLRISLAAPENLNMKLYDIFGKVVASGEMDLDAGLDIAKFDLYNLPSGNYFMHITLGQQTYIRKIVIIGTRWEM